MAKKGEIWSEEKKAAHSAMLRLRRAEIKRQRMEETAARQALQALQAGHGAISSLIFNPYVSPEVVQTATDSAVATMDVPRAKAEVRFIGPVDKTGKSKERPDPEAPSIEDLNAAFAISSSADSLGRSRESSRRFQIGDAFRKSNPGRSPRWVLHMPGAANKDNVPRCVSAGYEVVKPFPGVEGTNGLIRDGESILMSTPIENRKRRHIANIKESMRRANVMPEQMVGAGGLAKTKRIEYFEGAARVVKSPGVDSIPQVFTK